MSIFHVFKTIWDVLKFIQELECVILMISLLMMSETKVIIDVVIHQKRGWRVNFCILNYMNEYITLVKLMENLDSVNHAVNIDGVWIFDVDYKKVLSLVR